MSRMPLPMLTFILCRISRSKYRETVGNSAEECRGLIDLLTAEARQNPSPREQVAAVLALRPGQTAKVGV
jgi:2-dehydropantoate 2-reductase